MFEYIERTVYASLLAVAAVIVLAVLQTPIFGYEVVPPKDCIVAIIGTVAGVFISWLRERRRPGFGHHTQSHH